jgi:hypothetical protein
MSGILWSIAFICLGIVNLTTGYLTSKQLGKGQGRTTVVLYLVGGGLCLVAGLFTLIGHLFFGMPTG